MGRGSGSAVSGGLVVGEVEVTCVVVVVSGTVSGTDCCRVVFGEGSFWTAVVGGVVVGGVVVGGVVAGADVVTTVAGSLVVAAETVDEVVARASRTWVGKMCSTRAKAWSPGHVVRDIVRWPVIVGGCDQLSFLVEVGAS